VKSHAQDCYWTEYPTVRDNDGKYHLLHCYKYPNELNMYVFIDHRMNHSIFHKPEFVISHL